MERPDLNREGPEGMAEVVEPNRLLPRPPVAESGAGGQSSAAYRFGSSLLGLDAPRCGAMTRVVDAFRKNVKKARESRDWTEEDLGDASGLTPVQISRIERGTREVRLTTVVRLLNALEVPPRTLIDAATLGR